MPKKWICVQNIKKGNTQMFIQKFLEARGLAILVRSIVPSVGNYYTFIELKNHVTNYHKIRLTSVINSLNGFRIVKTGDQVAYMSYEELENIAVVDNSLVH